MADINLAFINEARRQKTLPPLTAEIIANELATHPLRDNPEFDMTLYLSTNKFMGA